LNMNVRRGRSGESDGARPLAAGRKQVCPKPCDRSWPDPGEESCANSKKR